MGNKLSEISVRFIKSMEYVGATGASLDRDIEIITKAKITHIKSGRNKPSTSLIKDFVNHYPQINYVWLLTGEGEMINYKSKLKEKDKIANEITNISEKLKDIDLENESKNKILYYPVGASAGLTSDGGSNESVKAEIITLPSSVEGSVCIPIVGDSMYPTLIQGDLAIMKETEIIRDDYIHVIYLNEGGNIPVIKRVKNNGKKVTLISDNEFYDPYEINKSDIFKKYIVTNRITGSMSKPIDYKEELDEANKRLDRMISLLEKQ